MDKRDDIKISKWEVAWAFLRDCIGDPWRMHRFFRWAMAMPTIEDEPSFGVRSRKAREYLGLSLEETGEILNVTAGEVADIESGTYD